MRKTFVYTIIGALVCSLMFTSCENLDDLEKYGFQPEILAPALKTEIDIYDFERLLTQTTDYTISPGDLSSLSGVPFPVDVPVPDNLIPSEYMNIFDFAEKIFTDTVRATISFDNIFPVAIKAGTRILVRDSSDASKVLIDHSIASDVPSGGSYVIPIVRGADTISSTLEITMTDFVFVGTGNLTPVNFPNQDFTVVLNVTLIDLDHVELKNNVSYEDSATHPFSIDIPNAADTAAYSGALSLFITNKYPTGFDLRLDLLDDNGDLVFPLFGDSSLFVEHAPLDATGRVIGQTVAEKVNFINVTDINNLNEVTQMRIGVTLKTPSSPSTVILDEITTIDMLITADIAVDPSKAN